MKSATESKFLASTSDRKYLESTTTFTKATLREREYITKWDGSIFVPYPLKERALNEVATLRWFAEKTNIPVPRVISHYEDDGSYVLEMELIDGVRMVDLSEQDRATAQRELQPYIESMRLLKSNRLGGVEGHVVPPYRVLWKTQGKKWSMLSSGSEEYVFCHNDLSQYYVLVDPKTLKIKAIIDWEYAGFYPEYFDSPYYKRKGPSGAIGDEVDDTDMLIEFLEAHADKSS